MNTPTGERIPLDQRDRALIHETSALLAADLTQNELFESLCDLLARFIDASVVFICTEHDDGRLILDAFHDHGMMRRDSGIEVTRESRTAAVMATGKSLFYGSDRDWDDIIRIPVNANAPETDDSRSGIFVPLQNAEGRLGVLSVQSQAANAYSTDDVKLLESIARYLAVAIRNHRLFERLRVNAEIDQLTGLYSHSWLLAHIDSSLANIGASDHFTIIVLDVTNFSLINDTYGAAEGDRALSKIAQRLGALEDSRTAIGRFGGDDFMILASRSTRKEIEQLVASVAARIGDLSIKRGDITVPVSTNIGYVVAPDEGRSRPQLLALANLRLGLSLQSGGVPMGNEPSSIEHFGNFSELTPIVEAALARDPYTRVHLIHVNRIAHDWAPLLGLGREDTEVFVRSALLHDIGKMLIAESILLKPAQLTRDEFTTMKMHAEYGANIVRNYPEYGEVARVIAQHHEFFNGYGYPNGIKGEFIHPLARGISVIDAFSAMTIDRPYHRGISEAAALSELQRCAGAQFDPEYVASFVALRKPEAVTRGTAAAVG